MVTIQIENETVKIKRGTSGRTGKPYEIREQAAVAHGIGRFPVEFKLGVPDDCDGYPAGHYEVTTPFSAGRFGLDVSRDLGLVLIKQPAASKAA